MTAWRAVLSAIVWELGTKEEGSAKAERKTGNHQLLTANPDTLADEDDDANEHEHDALPLTTLRVLVESATNGSD
jgi:hypothetical protein